MRYPHVKQRFFEKVALPNDAGCLLWLGATTSSGHGQLRGRTGRVPAHRFAYEMWVGPIPSGLELDHLCRVRRCVNPDHLEPVTRRENVLRGVGPTAQNANKTHCPSGHPLTGSNLKFSRAGRSRECRICRNERNCNYMYYKYHRRPK